MKKLNIKHVVIATTIITCASGAFALSQATQAVAGSDQDPVVTLSYVEKRIQDVTAIIDTKIKASNNQTGTVVTQPAKDVASNVATPIIFETVFVKKGQFVYFGASTEVILRSGDGTVIASVNGGLSDLTDGRDLENNVKIPANHHLLVPRDDGRGFALKVDSWVLIKGGYTIIE